MVLIDFDGASIAGGGLLQVACGSVAVAEVVVRRNVPGSKLDRLPVTSGRAGCVALAFQDVTQGVVGLGEVRIAHYDTADKVHGRAVVAHQVRHHAQKMQGIGMIRVSLQDLPIPGLGLGQIARRLVTAGLVQGGEERGVGCGRLASHCGRRAPWAHPVALGGPGLRLLGMLAEGAHLRALKVPARSARRSGRPR